MLLSGSNNGGECSFLWYPQMAVVFYPFYSVQDSVCDFCNTEHKAPFRWFVPRRKLLRFKRKGSCWYAFPVPSACNFPSVHHHDHWNHSPHPTDTTDSKAQRNGNIWPYLMRILPKSTPSSTFPSVKRLSLTLTVSEMKSKILSLYNPISGFVRYKQKSCHRLCMHESHWCSTKRQCTLLTYLNINTFTSTKLALLI